jgi:hypothetical protein
MTSKETAAEQILAKHLGWDTFSGGSVMCNTSEILAAMKEYGASLQPKEAEPTGEKYVRTLLKQIDQLQTTIKLQGVEWKRLMDENERLKGEIRSLKDWKESATKVMPDFQEIGKLLNVPIGEQVSPHIIPKIKALLNSTTANTQPKEDVRDYEASDNTTSNNIGDAPFDRSNSNHQ